MSDDLKKCSCGSYITGDLCCDDAALREMSRPGNVQADVQADVQAETTASAAGDFVPVKGGTISEIAVEARVRAGVDMVAEFDAKFPCPDSRCQGGSIPTYDGPNQDGADSCEYCFKVRYPMYDLLAATEARVRAEVWGKAAEAVKFCSDTSSMRIRDAALADGVDLTSLTKDNARA